MWITDCFTHTKSSLLLFTFCMPQVDKVQLSLQHLAACNTNPLLNYCSPLSVLKRHISALTCLPLSFFFSLVSSPSCEMLVGDSCDKSIAITLPVLSSLSRVSSSFIFILQQLLRDLSISLCLSCLEFSLHTPSCSVQPHKHDNK